MTTIREAKAIVALAVRNGPIEQVHAGERCPTCEGHPGYSRITDDEMKAIMKNAVDHVYALLRLRETDPLAYRAAIAWGDRFTRQWDDPDLEPFKAYLRLPIP